MKVKERLTKPSESDKVDAYMKNLKHPLARGDDVCPIRTTGQFVSNRKRRK